MSDVDGTIKIDTSVDGAGFNSGVSKMMSGGVDKLMGSIKTLGAAIGVAFGVGAVVAFGKSAVDAASQIQSAYIGLQSVVEGNGRSFSEAKTFIDDYISDGLVPASDAVTAYKNLLMRGYDTSQIEGIMNALKDSSAFGRQGSLTMGQAIQGASEGLKNENSILVDNAGVTKNVSMMWKDYAASIGTTVNSLTLAQKREAEYQGILYETRFQMGDAAKLSQTYGGRMAALGTSFQNLKVAIGNSIIPIINQVMPYIKAAVDALVRFFNTVAQLVNAFFGTNVSMASVGEDATAAAGGLNAAADAAGGAADAQGKLAKNTEKAGKAAKGSLAAFDQLNVLQTQDTSAESVGGGGGGGSVGGGIVAPVLGGGGKDAEAGDGALTALQEKVAAFKVAFLEFIQPVTDALGRLEESLRPLGETIWSGLKWAWDNILVPLGAWVITEQLPAFLDILGGAAELLNSILLALQPAWDVFWENVLKPLAEWTGGVIVDFLGLLADALKGLSDWIMEHMEGVQTFILVLGGLAVALWAVNAAVGFMVTVIGIVPALLIALGVLIYLLITHWEELSTTVKQIGWLMSYYLAQAWESIKKSFFAALNAIQEKFAAAWTTIQQIWYLAGVWFASVGNEIRAAFDTAMEAMKQKASEIWAAVKLVWNTAGAWFTGVGNSIKKAFDSTLDSVKTKFESVFTGIKTFVQNIIESIKKFIGNMATSIEDTIGGIIDGIGSIGDILPELPTTPTSSGAQSYSIPQLATGAVIPPNARFAAILGDQRNGTNIETPESLLRQIFREESGNNGGEITIRFEGSLGALVRELRPYIEQENTRFGKSLAIGAT
jgi:phage-related protein